jgi:hypothetical protein
VANELRLHANWVNGQVTDNPLLIGASTMNSVALASLPVVDTTNYAALTLDPASASPEIVWVTAHTAAATVATILRAQENTTAKQFSAGTRWVHAPTAYDYNYGKNPMTRLFAKANYR